MKIFTIPLTLLVLTGCGQHYAKPGCDDPISYDDPSCIVVAEIPSYQPITYPVMHSVLVDILQVGANGISDPDEDPLHYPDHYLYQYRFEVGEGDYANGVAPGPVTSVGYKTWLLASSSACGLAMEHDTTLLFPESTANYSYAFYLLLGRETTNADYLALDPLRRSFPDPVRGAAAVCTTLLNSLEFMDAN